jgi:small basic protein
MNIKNTKFTLIPHKKPKSWVLIIVAFVTNVLVAAPILLIGLQYDLVIIKVIGIFLFGVCCITYVCMLPIYYMKKLTGKYRSIEEREWRDQMW